MADTLTIPQRSARMSLIRAKNTRPELIVRRWLHSRGLRYRIHASDLPGKPDLVLPRYRTVVFVQGCFWHAHYCQRGRIPSTRSSFWRDKFEQNRRRDARNARALRRAGWRVLTIWECELHKGDAAERALQRLIRKISRSETQDRKLAIDTPRKFAS